MTLRKAINQAGQQFVLRAAKSIPSPLFTLTANMFTCEQFKELRKALEKHVATIQYSVRIVAVKEINDFFDAFFQDRFGKICRLERVFEGNELDILLLKALQGGTDQTLYTQSQADRAESFGMSTNAMQARIRGLEDGKEILGHQVRISIDGRGRVAYDDTIHPIFLTLNLKEVYLLTILLKRTFSRSPFEELADGISNDVFAQLSEYAKGVLAPHVRQYGMSFDGQQPEAQTAYRREKRDAVFFLKSQQRCVLQMIDGATYHGRIVISDNGICLLTDDGEAVALPDDHSTYSLEPED